MSPLSRGITRAIGVGAIVVAALLAGIVPARTQSTTDVARLEALSQELARRWERRRTPLYYDLLLSTNPTQRELNNRSDIQLMGIDAHGNPICYTTHNINAAATTRTTELWPSGASGYNLAGLATPTGVLGIWDAGLANPNHIELVGRVQQGDGWPLDHPHSTHVGGTMIATGLDPAAKGMSYEAHLVSRKWDNDTVEMAQAAAAGMQISNHSYGLITGWNSYQWWGDLTLGTQEDWRFGFYDSLAADWDQVAYNAPLYLIVQSAGNDRNDADPGLASHQHMENGQWVNATDYHPPDGSPFGFDTIMDVGCAKNILTVGAVKDIPGSYTQPSDVVMTEFSSWGPADDGRIKPDIVANGDSVYSSGTYPKRDSSYTIMSGTSMAAPNVSGSVNLVRELYEATYPGKPRSATLKALVLHTADEAGGADGPDYSFGWGLLNARAAADVVAAPPSSGSGIVETLLVNGNTDEYYFSVATPGDVRVTMVWTDPPGTPPAYVIDPVAKMLVNDLDLRLAQIGSIATYEPWRLDKNNPLGVATRGDNDVDNVERIDAYNVPAGDYRVTVSHKGTITHGEQPYSLVWTGMVPSNAVGVGPATGPPPFTLKTPYPNPASGVAVVQFSTGASGPTTIELFDPRGRRVKTLFRGLRPAGPGTLRLDTRSLPSGVYFVRMESASKRLVKKLTVVR